MPSLHCRWQSWGLTLLVRRGSGLSVGTSSWPAELRHVPSCPATPCTGALVSLLFSGPLNFTIKISLKQFALSAQCPIFIYLKSLLLPSLGASQKLFSLRFSSFLPSPQHFLSWPSSTASSDAAPARRHVAVEAGDTSLSSLLLSSRARSAKLNGTSDNDLHQSRWWPRVYFYSYTFRIILKLVAVNP